MSKALTSGRTSCELPKPVSLTYHLHVRLGKSIVLRALERGSGSCFGQNPTRKCCLDA